MKARFTESQPSVKVVDAGNKYYIFICLNEQTCIEEITDEDGDRTEQTCYEYDYNEVVTEKNKIDIIDVQDNPQNYIDYNVKETSVEERVQELEDALDMLLSGVTE